MSIIFLSEQVENSLRVLAASQAHEIVRREAIKVERQWRAQEVPMPGMGDQLRALRDREADLLQIITEEEL